MWICVHLRKQKIVRTEIVSSVWYFINILMSFITDSMKMIDDIIDQLIQDCRSELANQGFPAEKIKTDVYLNLRYDRTDCGIMCLPTASSKSSNKLSKHGDFLATFNLRYAMPMCCLL